MHILGISGSLRKDGNTAKLLHKVLEGAGTSYSFISLADVEVSACRGCRQCSGTGTCVIPDGMHSIYEELRRCDAVVLGSPVYFGNINASLKAVMDRTLCLFSEKTLKDKLGAAVACTGRDAADIVLGTISKFYTYHKIIYVGGVAGYGAITDEKEACREAVTLGERLVGLWRKMHG
jgi:multimeric flavodoxin WrbA